ncbi:uncharacterized protein BDZ83DRAFT_435802 [Colletotrichum acutatum]|uniref:Uncharacterized protein n=1 Tax=Glomerella acutata TaxID=27357 RepID=A0AAD8XC31_GLOAC|nr:uncharacterized protein BDZ83DRAFT_435802 [Colletotrichum acutatum]KAK1721463.1 hypothetical protein BDZ83DRAFT_435802 [Colletotrichum acutatum]
MHVTHRRRRASLLSCSAHHRHRLPLAIQPRPPTARLQRLLGLPARQRDGAFLPPSRPYPYRSNLLKPTTGPTQRPLVARLSPSPRQLPTITFLVDYGITFFPR